MQHHPHHPGSTAMMGSEFYAVISILFDKIQNFFLSQVQTAARHKFPVLLK